jgi:hypothetical protein
LVSWYKCNVYFCVQKGRKEFVTVSLTDVSIGQFTYEGSGWWSEGGQWSVDSGQWRVEEKASSVIYYDIT